MAFAKVVQRLLLRVQRCLLQHHPLQPAATGPWGESWTSIGILPSQEITTWVVALQVLIPTPQTLRFFHLISLLEIPWNILEFVRRYTSCTGASAKQMGWYQRFPPNCYLLQATSFGGLPFGLLEGDDPKGTRICFLRNSVAEQFSPASRPEGIGHP